MVTKWWRTAHRGGLIMRWRDSETATDGGKKRSRARAQARTCTHERARSKTKGVDVEGVVFGCTFSAAKGAAGARWKMGMGCKVAGA